MRATGGSIAALGPRLAASRIQASIAVVVVLPCVPATASTWDAASVSGFYLARPEAACFNEGRIGDDQIADWARRMALGEGEARRALAGVV